MRKGIFTNIFIKNLQNLSAMFTPGSGSSNNNEDPCGSGSATLPVPVRE
jgi:hypothetical protein